MKGKPTGLSPVSSPHSDMSQWLVRRGHRTFFAAHSVIQQTFLKTYYVPDTALALESERGRCSSY